MVDNNKQQIVETTVMLEKTDNLILLLGRIIAGATIFGIFFKILFL